MRKMSRNCYWAVRDKRNPRCFNCTRCSTDGINTYQMNGPCIRPSLCLGYADVRDPKKFEEAVRQRTHVELGRLIMPCHWMKDNGRLNIHHDEAMTLDWARSKILARMAGSKR